MCDEFLPAWRLGEIPVSFEREVMVDVCGMRDVRVFCKVNSVGTKRGCDMI